MTRYRTDPNSTKMVHLSGPITEYEVFFQVCSFLNSIKSGYIEKQKLSGGMSVWELATNTKYPEEILTRCQTAQCSLCLMCSCVPQSAGTTYGPIKNNTSQLLEQVRCANTAAQPPIVIPYFYESAHGTKVNQIIQ